MDAEDYLLKIPFWTKKKNSLAEVRKFLEAMGNPDHQMRIIHVAGTNGKGSVCAYLTAELMNLGYQVGTFISPHLVSVRERLLLNGRPADKESFQETFACLEPIVAGMVDKGYQHPSFFEYLFLMAMMHYHNHPVDFLILETGLGGLLDTTNVIDRPVLTVITSIGLDHTQYLGNTIEEIAAQKAGIIKPGCPLVYDDSRPEASAVLRRRAMQLDSPGYPAVCHDEELIDEFSAPYQARNAAVAVQSLEVLGVPAVKSLQQRAGDDGIGAEQAKIRRQMFLRMSRNVWPGRMEQIRPDIWLDGAHNEDGIRAFAEAARRLGRRRRKQVQLLFAAAADKDYHEMIAILCSELPLKTVTIAHMAGERAAETDKLAAEFHRHLGIVNQQDGLASVKSFPGSREAFAWALKQKTEDDILFVAGSLYLIGEIKASIMEEQDDNKL